MAVQTFLEQYLECMDSLPLDLQRSVSQLRELDYKTQLLLPQIVSAQNMCDQIVVNPLKTAEEQTGWLNKLYKLMMTVRKLGNQKLELTSVMLDTIEDYSHQLALKEKDMDNCRTREETGSIRFSSLSSNAHKVTPQYNTGDIVDKRKNDRGQKRSRASAAAAAVASAMAELGQEQIIEEASPVGKDVSKIKEGGGAVVNSTSSSSSSKPPKKKAKIKKRANSKDSITTPVFQPSQIPTPDFSTEPIDPDEPTYCLCRQVSFGEMIGCDNDDCSIEWFHFQCVGLTSKPKGKWYCPQCSSDRNKHSNKTTK